MSTSYPAFNLPALALQATSGISCLRFASRDIVFHQGAPSDSFYYVLEGKVQLSVVSEQGKEARMKGSVAAYEIGQMVRSSTPFRSILMLISPPGPPEPSMLCCVVSS